MKTIEERTAVDCEELLSQVEKGAKNELAQLQDQLEDVLWNSSNSINGLKRAKKELEREMERRAVLEQELRLAHKLESIGQLAAGVAHEINTPMQYIGDNISFLRKAFEQLTKVLDQQQEAIARHGVDVEIPGQSKLRFICQRVPRAIQSAEEGVSIVSNIVRAMKDFSHTELHEMSGFDVNAAIDTSLTVSKNEWKYVATVEQDFDPQLPEVEGYASELKQVFLNIIINAAHAIDARNKSAKKDPGVIRIQTSHADDHVKIAISDNGIGIPEEIRHRVFDQFFTTKDVGKGTGQGLSLAHRVVVQRHQGELRVESEVGAGTTFHILLPQRSRSGRVVST